MKGLGYRQRAILAAIEGRRAVPTGYIVRQVGCDKKTVHVALIALARRGLVVHVSHGKWAEAVSG